MSESDGNRKRAISSVSTEDGSTGTFAGPSGTNAGFTTYPTALAPSAPPPPPPPAATGGNKKRNKKGTRAASTAGAQVYLPPGVVISRSAEDCAPQLNLSKDQLIVTGSKGFRMARATHGVSQGTWYWECTVLPPETKEGHCRLGWSLPTGSLQAPVGYDKSSYAYRDISGSKVHESLRTDNYGEPWGPGDVVGFMIKLKSPSSEELRDAPGVEGDSGRLSVAAAAATLATGGGSSSERGAAGTAVGGAGANAGNEIRFFKNGKDQNVAFSGIRPGMYFPAVSLYMGGSVRVNFGPEFVYPPPSSHRCKPIANLRPLSKEEAKAQRTRTKQERAARGLETATRLSAGGSYLGTTSRSPPRSSSSQVPAAISSKGGAPQRGSNGDGVGGARSSKSGGRGDAKVAAAGGFREEVIREQAVGGKARRASSPAPGGSGGDKGGKGSGKDNACRDKKTELEVAKEGAKGEPLGGTSAKDRVMDTAGNQKASGFGEVEVRGDAAREGGAAVSAVRDVTAVEKALVGKKSEASVPTVSGEQRGTGGEYPRNTAPGEPAVPSFSR